MVNLWIDTETRSYCGLKESGLDRYAADPSTEMLMVAYAFDDAPVQLWQPRLTEMPEELRSALLEPSVTKCAWNVSFERTLLRSKLGLDIPLSHWYDPISFSSYLGFPRKLEKAAAALELAEQKSPEGKSLIRTFSLPSKATKKMLAQGVPAFYFKDWNSNPEEWKQFCEYCRQDVVTERAVSAALEAYNSPMPVAEYRAWVLDQIINCRGTASR